MRMRQTFSGGKELSAALAELGDEATVAGRRSLRATANMLRDAFKEAAPVDPKGPTRKFWRLKGGGSGSGFYGRLKDNIRVREARARKDHTIVMIVSMGNAFWGSFLEFGTKFLAARPWARPVFDRMHNMLISTLGKQLGSQIEKAAKRIARRNRAVLPNGRNG